MKKSNITKYTFLISVFIVVNFFMGTLQIFTLSRLGLLGLNDQFRYFIILFLWTGACICLLLLVYQTVRTIKKQLLKMLEIVRVNSINGYYEPVYHQHIPTIDDLCYELSVSLKRISDQMIENYDVLNQIKMGIQSEITIVETSDFSTGLVDIKDALDLFFNEAQRIYTCITQEDYTQRIELMGLSESVIVKIIRLINQMIDEIEVQMEWHEAVFDAIPYPIHVIDNDMKWKNLNQSLIDGMMMCGLINNKESAIGLPCSTSAATICNTESCGIRQAKEKGVYSTSFQEEGVYFRMDVAPIVNKSGEQLGYVEIGLDTTFLESLNNYVKEGLFKFGRNLVQIAKGNLSIEMSVPESNEFTKEMHEYFTSEIAVGLEMVRRNIENLIFSAQQIISAVSKGKMSVRADETKFEGSWKNLIHGINQILEEVSSPMLEISQVMDAISTGNLKKRINSCYQGDIENLVESVNLTGDQFAKIIGELSEKLEEIASGNLCIENVLGYQGDFNDLSNAFNDILTSLYNIVSDIDQVANQVSMRAIEVSEGSQSLAEGSVEQASALEQLRASISKIAENTTKNAESSKLVKILTLGAMKNAEKGSLQMNDMQESMDEIKKSSQDISKIINVIDDIAFQTNILALNAAIEAARAGLYGKGFAVVSEQVRILAARCAEAAKETTSLIENTIEKVNRGTLIADETEKALVTTQQGIEKITELISDITEASNKQAIGITQINIGIEQVAQVVQTNSKTAEQSADASGELLEQAVLLRQKIKHFQL